MDLYRESNFPLFSFSLIHHVYDSAKKVRSQQCKSIDYRSSDDADTLIGVYVQTPCGTYHAYRVQSVMIEKTVSGELLRCWNKIRRIIIRNSGQRALHAVVYHVMGWQSCAQYDDRSLLFLLFSYAAPRRRHVIFIYIISPATYYKKNLCMF